jgi:hypothetical protein
MAKHSQIYIRPAACLASQATFWGAEMEVCFRWPRYCEISYVPDYRGHQTFDYLKLNAFYLWRTQTVD